MSHTATINDKRLVALLGPTNTGKTHYAVERMLAHRSGMIGFPLRLLAREVYDRVVAIKGASRVALMTGEERIIPDQAVYFICTVESMPVGRPVEFLAIDEIQLAADAQRGHIFTERMLRSRGMYETMFMGADTIRPLMRRLLPDLHVIERPRFSKLSFSKPKKLSRLPRRSAIVAFTAEDVYGIAELIRRQKGGAAIVMGSLSPKTRNAQAELYQSGDVDYLVATDAIGMGLNLDIDHVVFAQTAKFDGRVFRQLRADEVGQIAGRAGRHMNDGTYSTLADGDAFLDDPTIERVEEHRFKTLKHLMWRNAERDFSSATRLIRSLERPSERDELAKAPIAMDLQVLKTLSEDTHIRDWAHSPEATRCLWEACQIPDFQKISFNNHLGLVRKVVDYLRCGDGKIAPDWIGRNIARLDNKNGDIDAIASRLGAIRIWTYIAHRKNWLQESAHWAYQSRAVEDKLSDALHQSLTQRFVDRRTTVLMRELKQKDELLVAINKDNSVEVEGHDVGQLDGFSFKAASGTAGEDQKLLQSAATKALRGEISNRVKAFCAADATGIELTCRDGLLHPQLTWNSAIVADLVKGAAPLVPQFKLIASALLHGNEAAAVLEKSNAWLTAQLDAELRSLVALKNELDGKTEAAPEKKEGDEKTEEITPLSGLARGIAFQLYEHLGIMPRSAVGAELRKVDQDARKGLWRFRIRIGASNVFVPYILKPAPTRLRLILWALSEGHVSLPVQPTPGMVWVDMDTSAPRDFYRLAGFHPCGQKAVRVDMVERLADAVRPLGKAGEGFEVTPEIMGLVGLSGADFAAVMAAIGYNFTKLEAEPTKDVDPAAEEDKKEKEEAAPRYSFKWKGTRKPAQQRRPQNDNKGNQKSKGPKKPRQQAKRAKPQEKPIDANSPFAALASLKASMSKK